MNTINYINFVNCPNCQHEISKTALMCPACGKTTEDKKDNDSSNKAKSAANWVGATAVTVALGPAALLAGAAALAIGAGSNRSLKKTAKKVGAIDCFILSDDWTVLVTRNGFIWYSDSPYPEVPWQSIKEAHIDESRSREGGLLSSAKEVIVITRIHTPNEVITEKYKITGKQAREVAEIACGKFREYAFGERQSSKINEQETKNAIENSKSDDLYKQAWEEVEEGNYDKALFAQAFAEADGNTDKAKAFYLKKRVKQLKKSTHQAL